MVASGIIARRAQANPDTDAELCKKCGFPLRWVDKQDRWYCYRCRRYTQKVYKGSPIFDPNNFVDTMKCGTCRKDIAIEVDARGLVDCPHCGARNRVE